MSICIRRLVIVFVLFLLVTGAAHTEPTQSMSLNGTWEMGAEPAKAQMPEKWESIKIPGPVPGGTAHIPQSTPIHPTAWFKRSFDLPDNLAKRRFILRFNMVNYACQVFANDKPAGEHVGGFTPFEIDITSLVKPGPNSLAVRVTDISAIYGEKLAGPGLMEITYGTREFLAPSGTSLGRWGIVDNVTLKVVPEAYISDIYVKPSVRNKSVSAEVTVRNASDTDFAGKLLISVMDGDKAVVRLPVKDISIPKGEELITECAPASAKNLTMWWPGKPKLYHMRVELIDSQSRPVNEDRVRFGYRELWIEGERFKLNGVFINLFGTGLHIWDYPSDGSADPKAVYKAMSKTGCNIIRLYSQPCEERAYELADEMGIMLVNQSAIFGSWCHGRVDDPVLWKNCADHLRGWMRRDRNHPSVVIWDLSNEMGWEGSGKAVYPEMTRLYHLMQQMDDTRPVMADGDGDVAGVLPIVNLHYPEFDYPGAMYPENAYWFESTPVYPFYYQNADQPLRGKPVYIGEFSSDYTGYTGEIAMVGGDRVFLGWKEMQPVRGEVVRTYIEAHRWNSVPGIAPWTVFETGEIPNPYSEQHRIGFRPLAILMKDVDSRFYSGDTPVRRVKIANDSLQTHIFDCRWTLTLNGKTVQSGQRKCHIEPAGRYPFEIKLRMPKVAQRTQAKFVIKLMEGSSVRDTIVKDYWIFPKVKKEKWPANTRVWLYEPSGSKTAECLRQTGIRFSKINNQRLEALKTPAVLVVAAGEVDAALKDRMPVLQQFVDGGGVVICLEQKTMSLAPDLVHQGRGRHSINFVRAPLHPIFTHPYKISDNELKWWRGSLAVCEDMFTKPVKGAFKVLADGGFGNRGASLVVVSSGRGRWITSQLRLIDAFDSEPMAAEILKRVLRCGISHTAAKTPLPRIAVYVDAEFTDYLSKRRADVKTLSDITDESLNDCRTLILRGKHLEPLTIDPNSSLCGAVRKFAQNGGTVYINGYSTSSEKLLASILAQVTSESANVYQAVRSMESDLTEGIGNSDLFWLNHGWGIQASSDVIGTRKFKIPGAKEVLQPGLLQEVKLGKGRIVIDQINWFDTNTPKAKLVGAAILTNLGVGGRTNQGAVVNEKDFVKVDLRKHANRTFADEKAGDGKGGWTDQGDNDLAQMPTGKQVLEGVPYDIIPGGAPQAIILGGRSLDVPREVKGIKVGTAAASLIFLHGAAWCDNSIQTVWRYIVRYRDGQSVEIPVQSEVNVRDWWSQPAELPSAVVAWTGGNKQHAPVSLYAMEWKNPKPQVPIDSIDVVNGDQVVPFVLAITARKHLP